MADYPQTDGGRQTTGRKQGRAGLGLDSDPAARVEVLPELPLLGLQLFPLDLLERRGELLLLLLLLGAVLPLLLLLLLLQELGVAGLLIVDAALGLLLALPAAGALVLARGHGRRRVPVAHGLVAAVEQGVVGDVALGDVGAHLGEGPVEQGVDLDDAALLVELEDRDLLAAAALAAAAAREHGGDAQVRVGALLRLDLGDPVVQLRRLVVQALAVARLELGRRRGAVGPVDVQRHRRVARLHARHEVVGLGEVVQRVQEDGLDARQGGVRGREAGQHVDGHEAREPEGGGLVQVREELRREAQALHGGHLLHLLVQVPQVRLREHDLGEAGDGARG